MDVERNWIAVTGASGFIGRHLVEKLLTSGERVVAISRGRPDVPSLDRALSAGQARLVTKPEPDANDLRHTAAVIMLAGLAHRSARTTPATEYVEVNTNLSVRTAKAAIAAGCRRLVYVSTVAVHGDGPFSEPIDESAPIDPTTPYARSKWQAEQALDEVCREAGVTLIRLRPPLVYAPNAPGSIAMLRKAIGWRIPLPFASIQNRRSLIAVQDLVNFFESIVQAETCESSVILIANAQPVSTPDIVRHIASALRIEPWLFSFSPKLLAAMLSLAKMGRLRNQLLHDYMIKGRPHQLFGTWSPQPYPLVP